FLSLDFLLLSFFLYISLCIPVCPSLSTLFPYTTLFRSFLLPYSKCELPFDKSLHQSFCYRISHVAPISSYINQYFFLPCKQKYHNFLITFIHHKLSAFIGFLSDCFIYIKDIHTMNRRNER